MTETSRRPDQQEFEEGLNRLNSLAAVIHQRNVEAGWFSDPETGERIDRNVPEMLCLMHSEISEALEGYRKGEMDKHLPHRKAIEVELADLFIRQFDLIGYLDLDIRGAVLEKANYNLHRADHKIENRRGENGKKF